MHVRRALSLSMRLVAASNLDAPFPHLPSSFLSLGPLKGRPQRAVFSWSARCTFRPPLSPARTTCATVLTGAPWYATRNCPLSSAERFLH